MVSKVGKIERRTVCGILVVEETKFFNDETNLLCQIL